MKGSNQQHAPVGMNETPRMMLNQLPAAAGSCQSQVFKQKRVVQKASPKTAQGIIQLSVHGWFGWVGRVWMLGGAVLLVYSRTKGLNPRNLPEFEQAPPNTNAAKAKSHSPNQMAYWKKEPGPHPSPEKSNVGQTPLIETGPVAAPNRSRTKQRSKRLNINILWMDKILHHLRNPGMMMPL